MANATCGNDGYQYTGQQGGPGGYVETVAVVTPGATYTVQMGEGGSGATFPSGSASNGSNSEPIGPGNTILATGEGGIAGAYAAAVAAGCAAHYGPNPAAGAQHPLLRLADFSSPAEVARCLFRQSFLPLGDLVVHEAEAVVPMTSLASRRALLGTTGGQGDVVLVTRRGFGLVGLEEDSKLHQLGICDQTHPFNWQTPH